MTVLEPQVKAKVERLCARLDERVGFKDPIILTVACVTLTMDILTESSFGQRFGFLEESFNVRWIDTSFSIVQFLPMIRHFWWFLVPLSLQEVLRHQSAGRPLDAS